MNIREHRQTLFHPDLEENIRKQAYYLWQQEGCPDGHALDHWLAAEEVARHRNGDVPTVRLRQRERRPLAKLAAFADVR